MNALTTKSWLSLIGLVVVMGLLLFVPAGTTRYWQAWIYLAIVLGASGLLTLHLARHDPALLKRRLSGGATAEKESAQKIIMLCMTVCFVALLVVPAFDHRFGWSSVPIPVVIAGDLLAAVGFWIIFQVYRENTFASATIEVAADQRVISTGPYAIVRHPMYAGGFLYLLVTPLALGSWWGLLVPACMAPLLGWRLLDEERFLSRSLPGYAHYCSRLRWRMIPGLF